VTDAGYSSSISGDRPDEVARIRRLAEDLPEPPDLWEGVPSPDGPPITEPWDGLYEAVSGAGFPIPEDRGEAVMSEMGQVEYVADLIRPGRILVHAATEGSGKSYTECELGIRVAVAGGDFAGTWSVLRNGPVLFLSEMHEDDDFVREDIVLSSLGLDRSALKGRYYRLNLLTAAGGPPALTVPEWREWVTGWLRDHEALVLIIDTATGASQVDPWGKDMQTVYADLRMMLAQYPALAIILVVHLKKPAAGSGGKRDISAVMGEWGRWCDVVMLQENEGDSLERTRLTTLKRVSTQRRIVATKSGGLLIEASDVEDSGGSHVPTALVLGLIEAHPGITYAELATELGKSRDTATRYVLSLRNQVERRSEGAGKAIHLYLTSAPPQTSARAHAEGSAEVPPDTSAPPHAPYRGAEVRAEVGTGSAEVAPIPSKKADWLRPCRHFVAHQSHHRQTPGGWVCDACDIKAAAA
jgi:hypothetical protein